MSIRSLTASVAALMAGVAGADPGFTTVNPPNGLEASHADVLSGVFGGVFAASGLDFSNGVVTASRVPDFDSPGILELLTGDDDGPEDQIWSEGGEGDGGEVTLMLKAEFAGDQSTFGWMDGAAGGTFNPLFDTQNNAGASMVLTLSGEFRWALDDTSFGNLVTSSQADQTLFGAPVDQMVAYHLTGTGKAGNNWLLFFEDRIGGDYDFNDAVISVSVVPAPASAGILGLAGLFAARRRR